MLRMNPSPTQILPPLPARHGADATYWFCSAASASGRRSSSTEERARYGSLPRRRLLGLVVLLGLVMWSIRRRRVPDLHIECDSPIDELMPTLSGLTLGRRSPATGGGA